MPTRFRDYYDVLGVSRTATADEIKKAYRDQLAKVSRFDARTLLLGERR